MEETFDYSQVPHDFVHCFNAQCPRAGECLRQFVARHVTADVPRLHMVNPLAYPQEGAVCAQFTPIKPIRLGWGLRKAVNRMPHGQAEKMTRWLNHFYPRMTLSRVMNCKRPIKPEEQRSILRAFRSLGVTGDDVFDAVTMSYDWNAKEVSQ